jgi:hypothetical protein
MRPLAALERFLERLFERPTARLLHARLEPVTLARRLERAIDAERRATADGLLAPTRFVVQVNVADAASLAGLDGLEDQLAAAALEHARRRKYRIPERPTVALVGVAFLEPGDVRVVAGFPDRRGSAAGPGPAPDRTLVHPVPVAIPPGTVLRVIAPGREVRDFPLVGRPLTIGRGADADVVVPDPLVSRRHAQLTARGATLFIVDLGSTNGTRVNGASVREAPVGPDDRMELGTTRLEIVVPGAGLGT